jgi:hypothetical protein
MGMDFAETLAETLELTAGPTVRATSIVIPGGDRVAPTWAHATFNGIAEAQRGSTDRAQARARARNSDDATSGSTRATSGAHVGASRINGSAEAQRGSTAPLKRSADQRHR